MGNLDKSSRDFSLTISSLVFPPPLEESLGRVSMIVLIISKDSFNRKVRSALEWRPNTSGWSVGGSTPEIYS